MDPAPVGIKHYRLGRRRASAICSAGRDRERRVRLSGDRAGLLTMCDGEESESDESRSAEHLRL